MANEIALLEGLKGQGITLNTRSLAKFTAENGVLVNICCGRIRGRVSLPPKLLGLRPEKWDKGSQSFFADHIAMGQLTMVPKEFDARLNQLDTRARRLVQYYTINGSYMPLAEYAEFKEQFEEIRRDYLDTIKEIAEQWDIIRRTYIEGVRSTVESRAKRTMLKRDREKLVQEIINAIPNAQQYKASAYMTVEVRAFPVTGVTAPGLASDIEDMVNKTWKNDVVSNAIKSIETSLGDIFSKSCQIAATYAKTDKINARSLSALKNLAVRVRKMNIFANPILDTLAKRLSALDESNDESAEFEIEESIADIWEYACKTGVNLDMSICPLSEDNLNNIIALRSHVGP